MTEATRYILDENGEPRPEEELIVWAKWYEHSGTQRIVAQDRFGDVQVSTVFLSIDHDFLGGPPILWETMIFGGKHDGYQDRYYSKQEAIEGHAVAVKLALEKE